MQFKFSLLFLFLISYEAANATVLVNPPPPYPQIAMGTAMTEIDYAGRSGGVGVQGAIQPSLANSMNTTQGYRYLNTSDTSTNNGLIFIDVSTDKTMTVGANQTLAVTVVAGSNSVVLTGASIASGMDPPLACIGGGGTCFNDYTGAIYTAGNTLRLSFTVQALCNASNATGGTGVLCNGSGNPPLDASGTTLSQSIQVNFGVVSTSPTAPVGHDVTVAASPGNDQSASFNLKITDVNPSTSCPALPINNFYFPGDSQIYFYAANFPTSTTTTANVGVPVQYLLTMAVEGPTATDFESGGLTANSIVHYTPATASTETITGFTNTTTGPGGDHQYAVLVQAENQAGLVSANTSECVFPQPVQSQSISGILTESKCFIATAAYQDGRAAPVMMLRKFRDKILSKFSLGRNFIKTYYEYSPALAEWAWDKPFIRSIALKVLAPIELMAWGLLEFSSADETQPYIDRVKKSLPSEADSPASTGSYTEQEKKKLEDHQKLSPEANQSYIERLKKKLADEDKVENSSESYTEKEKTKLPTNLDRESPITQVKEGRDHKLGVGEVPDIKSAAVFKLGVTPGMQVTVANGVHSFSDVYGTGFQPELLFHFEHQLFHSENFGSLGLGTDFGLAYAGGKGLLQFSFAGSNQSITGFSFIQVPVLFNAAYRFNLLRVVRPYVSVGSGAILYTETRNDSKGDKRGYSAVYSGNGGISILMDFLDSRTSRDSYLSTGIQHTYLFIEYLYLNTFKSSVMFKRAGIYSGFLFEF